MAKKNLFETMEFDNYAQAKDLVDGAEKKVKRILIGLGIAAVATLFTVIGLCCSNEMSQMVFFLLAFLFAIPAYIVGGGLGKALKVAKKLAVLGWIIVPFPIDILTGLCTFIVAIYALFFVPIIFVLINYSQHRKDLKAAQKYLSYFKPAETSESAE